jgi:hypothetical protein
LAQLPDLSRELGPARVLVRFFLRMSILLVFAAFAGIGFARALGALLWMAIILCAVTGTMKREQPFGAALNHWDEMVSYAALFALVSSFNHAVAA